MLFPVKLQTDWILFSTVLLTVVAHIKSLQPVSATPETVNAGHWNETISDEKRLAKFLLSRYERIGRNGRPVVNISEAINVTFGLGLIQMDLDERDKVLTTSMWSRLRWNDVYMRWNPADYGGVYATRLESDQVWIPDIMLYNTADPEGAARNALVVVLYDGTMSWLPHRIFKSSCSINVRNFPFDHQQCTMWFGSWTHNQLEIDLNLLFESGIDLETFNADYKDSCEWDIARIKAEKLLLPPNDTTAIAVLSFQLDLQRKLVFSSYILTLPCVFLAALTLVVFCLPPDRPDRTGLAMNLFQSFLVLLLILVEAAPPTASSVPTLGVYYCFNLVIIILSIYLSSLVVNIHKAEATSKPVPYAIQLVVLKGLGPLLFLSLPNTHPFTPPTKHPKHSNGTSSSNSKNNNSSRTIPDDPEAHKSLLTNQFGEPQSVVLSTDDCDSLVGSSPDKHIRSQICRYLLDIRRILDFLHRAAEQKARGADSAQRLIMEWRQVARVLDRFFFLVYLAAIVISLVFFFPKPPGVPE